MICLCRLRAAWKPNGDGTKKTRTCDRVPRAVPAPEANAELQINLDVCYMVASSNKITVIAELNQIEFCSAEHFILCFWFVMSSDSFLTSMSSRISFSTEEHVFLDFF